MYPSLVLEGGAMRGLFTAGILDVLMEQGMTGFPCAVGVSAGACFGCNIKSNQPGRAIRYNKQYCTDWRYHSIRSWITTGDMYGANFCYRDIPERLDPFDYDTYQNHPMQFWACATDALTGEAVYHQMSSLDANDLQFMRASASMPLVSKPVDWNGRKLLDGGMADSIPLRWMEQQGYPRSLVILTRPLGYRKTPMKHLSIYKAIMKDAPGAVQSLETRYIRYNETLDYIAKREQEGTILVLRPDHPLTVSPLEKHPEKLEETYQHGRTVALRELAKIQEFIEV